MLKIFATKLFLAVLPVFYSAFVVADAGEVVMGKSMKVRLLVGDAVLNATLENNAASRDFMALLPLELTLSDYHSTEKIADLPVRLSTQGAPDGIDPEIGDITYYSPWGNLAIFYRDFPYAKGLIRLGRMDEAPSLLSGSESLRVRIEKIQ
ncbi:cyclophilin-like fold protein [Thiomicrorhabdus sp. 6S3-12]|uniref:cyclophilin-like fold protein n=1 Tax=Thiomicrorhabdus sp. 6S3-12 TaxID=2819681 RepID=UPI001AAC509A|nr:cyclophilin-like fold protein [Thiomicrorhabdus sp. 6S3-12]MBO1923762.1 hypothetical protein [Thiomicrorhabdus sp. 6S3-12]